MNDVNVDYRKRMITVKDLRHEGFLIQCHGYEDVKVMGWDELEDELEKLHEKERVRLSYKKA